MSAPSGKQLRKAALSLVRDHDQPIFPCKAHGSKAKAPLTKNGLHDATTDEDRIRLWFKTYGDKAAIGLPTGIVWDVLDVDTKGDTDGRVHLPSLQRLGLLNGCQFVVRTPSGGWHLYFPAAPGLTNRASASLGLDVRALGGYVLAPPSYLITQEYSGGYEHMGPTVGANGDPLRWDLIVSALQPIDEATKKPIPLLPSERKASVASLREWVSARQAGERNNALHWAVCRCIDNNIDPHELVEAALLSGLEQHEVMLTVNSALRRAGLMAEQLQTEAEALFPDDA